MRNSGTALFVLLAVAVGSLSATLLHNYPKDYVTRYRYCLRCAVHEQTYREMKWEKAGVEEYGFPPARAVV